MNSPMTLSCTVYAKLGLAIRSPWAQLIVTCDRLRLQTRYFGTFEFRPDQLVNFEPIGLFPFLGEKILIHHVVEEYPHDLCFGLPFRRATVLLDRIEQTGFRPSAEPVIPWEPGRPCPVNSVKKDDNASA